MRCKYSVLNSLFEKIDHLIFNENLKHCDPLVKLGGFKEPKKNDFIDLVTILIYKINKHFNSIFYCG